MNIYSKKQTGKFDTWKPVKSLLVSIERKIVPFEYTVTSLFSFYLSWVFPPFHATKLWLLSFPFDYSVCLPFLLCHQSVFLWFLVCRLSNLSCVLSAGCNFSCPDFPLPRPVKRHNCLRSVVSDMEAAFFLTCWFPSPIYLLQFIELLWLPFFFCLLWSWNTHNLSV